MEHRLPPRDRRGRFRRERREGTIFMHRVGSQWLGRYVPKLWPADQPRAWLRAASQDALYELILADIAALHPNRDVIATANVLCA